MRVLLLTILRRAGYAPQAVSSAHAALSELSARSYDLVLTDLKMPHMTGLELTETLARQSGAPPVIVMTAYGSVETALEAMKQGAYDYISKPFKPDEIVLVLRKAEERERLKRENQRLRAALDRQTETEPLVAHSAAMREILRAVRKIAEYKTTVLVTGESGTGKELIAKALHDEGPRAQEPFVAVNCGAIAPTLLESEMFGHVKGAFTDALRDKKGLFEQAQGGTLFLDEIGELPLELQVKLLRTLQEQTVRRLGDSKETALDVRVVAATGRDLDAEVAAGRFRQDLYYRLNVVHIHVPPLRERSEEIPALVKHFLARHNEKLRTDVRTVSPQAMKKLIEYPWPGNVRELGNIIESAIVLSESGCIEAENLPPRCRDSKESFTALLGSGEFSVKKTTRVLEEELIRRALKAALGNRTQAAKLLEISYRALLYKIKDYNILDI